MASIDSLALGLLFLAIGLGLSVLIVLVLRFLPKEQPRLQSRNSSFLPLDLDPHAEAVLLVQPGGRLSYLNQQARQLFELGEEIPNLEHLARRARPSEAFFSLCAAEGQASFSLDGRLIEGVSYQVPHGAELAVLVSLRRPQFVLEGDGSAPEQTGFSDQALKIITELSQAIAASLDLETTLQTILESIERLIPADLSEINLFDDEDSSQLVSYSLSGLPEIDKKLEKSHKPDSANQSYTGYLLSQHAPLLIADVESFRQVRPPAENAVFPYKSYLGVPMDMAGSLIGTLELHSFGQQSFNETDLELLKILSGHAALAIHNARIYEGEQRRALELAGLARLAQAVSAQHAPEELFKHLVESITPLLDVKILGFLVYDENRRVLEGQAPFMGMHTDVLEWARFPLPADSPAEQTWLEQRTIVSKDAPEDSHIKALGLHHLAYAAGIRHIVLAPLTSSGQPLGYLLVADKLDGDAFNQSDLRILSIISGQSAAIIENASLVEQSRRRAQRAETLRRIASLTASHASLEEVLKFSLLDLSRLVQADRAAIFLLDERRGEVTLHKPSLFGVPADIASRLGRLPVDDPQFRNTITGSQRAYFGRNVMEDTRVLPVYRPIVQTLEIRSAIVVPLILRDTSLGELMLGSQKSDFFSQSDMQTVSTAAEQLAGAIDRANLSSQTDEKLRLQVDQLTAVNRISRELNSSLELNHMLQRVYDEVMKTTRADCGTIMLFQANENGRHSVSSDSPQIAIHLGEAPDLNLHPLERAAIERGKTLIVRDFEQTIVLRQLNDPTAVPPTRPVHVGIRSAMVIPIAYQGKIAGVIHLHAKTPNRFDETSQEIAETLSSQAAIALGNAHRYQEQVRKTEMLNRRVDTMAKLLETTQALQTEQPLEQALNEIASAIQASTPFNSVLVSTFDSESQNLLRVAGAGIQSSDMEVLRACPQAWSSLQAILKPEFRLGRSYFIPIEKMPVIPPEVHTLTVLPLESITFPGNGRSKSLWHPEDMLVVPLMNAGGEPLGLISVDAPRDQLRPDLPTIETLEIFSSQASLIIENQRKFDQLQHEYQQAQHELVISRKSSRAVQEVLPHVEQEEQKQARDLHLLSESLQRFEALLQIQQAIIRESTRSGALLALAQGLISHLEMETVLFLENDGHRLRLEYALGRTPEEANLEALLGQRNPLTYCLQHAHHSIVPWLQADLGWNNSPLLQSLGAEAFICLSIQSEPKAGLALLATRSTPLPPEISGDLAGYELLSDQLAAKLSSLQSVQEVRSRLDEANLLLEFNQRLNSLEPAMILHTLLENALQVAHGAQAGMVLLWDASQSQLVPVAVQGYSNPQPLLETTFQLEEEPFGRVFRSMEPLNLSEVDFARHYNLSSANLLRYRAATARVLPVAALALPIRASAQSQVLGILLLENFQSSAAFPQDTQAAQAILCQQTALHLENTRLFQAAEERASQMQALTQVAAAITAQLEPAELIATLLDQLHDIVPYETGTLWLLRDSEVVIRAARGFADEDERIGLTAALEDSLLLNEMISQGKPVCVADIRLDPRFPSLLEPRYLSWAGIPLISGGKVLGVIALEKSETGFYTPEHIQLATTFAGQAAVALANANLFQESLSRTMELDQRTKRLEMLNRLSSDLSETLDPDRLLAIALQELTEAITCATVSAVLFNPSGVAQVLAEIPSTGANSLELPENQLFERIRQTLGIFVTEDVSREAELAPLQEYLSSRGTQALLVLPLTTGSQLHGLLLVQADRPYRFSSDEIGLGRTISNQTAIAIQNAQLYAKTRDLTADLEQRVNERTAELAQEHRRTETLLNILTELSSSLDLEQVLNRTLKLLHEIIAAGQVSVLIIRPGEQKLHRLASVGYAAPAATGGSPTPFDTDESLAGWVIAKQEAALIDDLLEDPRWISLADAPEPHHRSAIAVPLLLGKEILGALLLYHDQVGYFTGYHLDLVQAAANQIAVTINNAELYRLIRDQAEDLGVMVRNQQIEASRSRAILEAVADGVLVTDTNQKITLFNASAEKILGLDSTGLLGKSLEHFTGLFGGAAHSWMETIHAWSQAPASLESGDIYTEQIKLEDGQVVSVHLAPVTLRESFLGTVSVFRDITHQVKIDRLKSEFVATVSHELRTPMTSIKGYVELMLMGAAGPLGEQQNHFLDIIKENTDRLTILVNDLLDISRIEAGRVTLSLQPLDLLEIARVAVEHLRHRSSDDQKPMRIEIEPAPDLPMALGDLERVRQIIENLLENAYCYTATNGHIRLRLHQVSEHIQVEIQDNGIGIHPDLHQQVFERFYRGEHPFVLSTSGTGLGLSIVRHLVEMHGGRIWLESWGLPGEGSTFYFTLPVYPSNYLTT
ncbi:MAG TPA: GAF domain-containing protein [Anaerolineales bacterium]|nr:GAF domain-containing protein [Anaerolineales bacterium]